MKKVLAIIVLGLLFSGNAYADDIKDFEIEGISIGDSLLKYYSKKKIKKSKKATNYKSKEFVTADIKFAKKTYDLFRISYIKKDSAYLIHGISGNILYKNNIDECYPVIEKIMIEASKIFENTKSIKQVFPHQVDKSGKSIITNYNFEVNGGSLSIACVDYSKKMEKKGRVDFSRINLSTNVYNDWLRNKAYK